MKILISNDDGYQAKGITTLFETLSLNHECIIVAPDRERSSCGHGITLGAPVEVNLEEKGIYSCSGLPADCILVGLGGILQGERPDLIFSGINFGANLGQDRYYSGTIAAAREGAFRGVPSIALSLVCYEEKDHYHFESLAKVAEFLLDIDFHQVIPENCLININCPNLSLDKISEAKLVVSGQQNYSEEIVKLSQDSTTSKDSYLIGGYYIGAENLSETDGEAINQDNISIDLQELTGRVRIEDTKLNLLKGKIRDLNELFKTS